jgi:aryl-alcohol dehydrogenase-like predicted oxidoreductase
MQYRRLGRSQLKVSSIIMGTFQAGKTKWVGIEDAQSRAAIRAAYDAGVTTFDTAEAYGKGHAESILGETLADVRHAVVLATKVSPNRLGFDQVLNACHNSLKRLHTDYIDLYQIHWPSASFGGRAVPIHETMAAMNKLKQQGKIRAIGVSNFSRSQLEDALEFGAVDSLQPPYSLFWRQIEPEIMPSCTDNDVTVLAYSPMAQGLLTGKFGPDHKFEAGDHRSSNKLFQPDIAPRVHRALGRLEPVAADLGLTLAQLSLAWVISHSGTCAIAGARNADQAVMNARAGDISLSVNTITGIEEIGRIVTDHLEDDPVMWLT